MATLSGTAKLADGSPASEVVAVRRSTGSLMKVIPDPTGLFSLEGVGGGEWLVSALGPVGYRPQSHLIVLETDPDPYWNQVVSLLQFDGLDGGTAFVDGKGIFWTPNGDAQLDDQYSKFGGSSLKLDGNGDYLSALDSDAFHLPGDFTIEAFLRLNLVDNVHLFTQLNNFTSDNNRFMVGYWSGGWNVYSQTTIAQVNVNVPDSPPVGQWFHFAVSRSGSNIRFFRNGVLVGTGTSSGVPVNVSSPAYVGLGRTGSALRFLDGWIDSFRITKGVARYLENFTPPVDPFSDFGP